MPASGSLCDHGTVTELAWLRRQTLDSGFSGVSSPLEAKFPNDGNTGFWRTGREVKEWGEHHGTVPPALLTGSAFSNSGMAPRPGWDASSSHARVLSSMDVSPPPPPPLLSFLTAPASAVYHAALFPS